MYKHILDVTFFHVHLVLSFIYHCYFFLCSVNLAFILIHITLFPVTVLQTCCLREYPMPIAWSHISLFPTFHVLLYKMLEKTENREIFAWGWVELSKTLSRSVELVLSVLKYNYFVNLDYFVDMLNLCLNLKVKIKHTENFLINFFWWYTFIMSGEKLSPNSH